MGRITSKHSIFEKTTKPVWLKVSLGFEI